MADTAKPQLSVGQTGHLSGQPYRVAGIILMSMDEEGVTYFWNEFHLIGSDGTSALLVEEEGKHGPEWRLFRLIEPAQPISASEAAGKRLGETYQFDGHALRITCVDESTVVRIEGQAPEGVEEGDVARYFNAQSGNLMIVVSWTGDEVEVFRGVQLPRHAVYRAFGLKPPLPQVRARGGDGDSYASSVKSFLLRHGIVAIIIGIVAFNALSDLRLSFGSSKPRRATAPNMPRAKLAVGVDGVVDGSRLRITGRSAVEIRRVGQRHARQEYWLADETGAELTLVQGSTRSDDDWFWLRPVKADPSLTPRQAGAKKLGATLQIDNATLQVTDLFLTQIREVEGLNTAPPGTWLYGLEAQGNGNRVVLRWTDNDLMAHRITPAAEREIQGLKR
jgi:hypothetical protein